MRRQYAVHLYQMKIQMLLHKIPTLLCHAGKGKSLHKLNLNWQCMIGPGLAFKTNASNTSKVQNSCIEVFYNLNSMIQSLYRSMQVLKVHLNSD